MGGLRADLAARLLRATVVVDRSYHAFDRARSALVLALASDAVLDRYNDLLYGASKEYRPDSPRFFADLFPWEEAAIRHHFPPPSARIVIGGAGGGREALALAARGYDVLAFEPSPQLVGALAAHLPPGLPVAVYRAAYEDLPTLFPTSGQGAPSRLDEQPAFAAGIFGWGSFAHLKSEAQRVHALRAMAEAVDGPLLLSLLGTRVGAGGGPTFAHRLRRRLPGRNRERGNRFAIDFGLFWKGTDEEIASLLARAGLEVVDAPAASEHTAHRHLVVRRRQREQAARHDAERAPGAGGSGGDQAR